MQIQSRETFSLKYSQGFKKYFVAVIEHMLQTYDETHKLCVVKKFAPAKILTYVFFYLRKVEVENILK
jgi:hypothetical protein